jgi:hypothetical protein
MMRHEISRRDWMKRALLASALIPALGLIGRSARAQGGLTPLDPKDPQAKSLGFVTDASKVDPKAFPTFKKGQHCGNCAQYQGKPTDPMAGCNIFAGHSVPAAGWCKVWVQRSG